MVEIEAGVACAVVRQRHNDMDIRLAVAVVSVALGIHCVAQSIPPELASRIEQWIRVSENVPVHVKFRFSVSHAREFAGYRALNVVFDENGGSEHVEFLLSDDERSLIRLMRFDLAKDSYADIVGKIAFQSRPMRGSLDRKIMVVVYDDFECPFCARVHQTLFPELLKEYGDRVTFVYKDFPLAEIHPWAVHAAINANCLAAQNSEAYWDFTDYVHANQQIVNADKELHKQFAARDGIALQEAGKFGIDRTRLKSCINSHDERAIKGSLKEGGALGITGTPTVFVNGEKLDGAASASELRAAFDRAIHDADARKTAIPQP